MRSENWIDYQFVYKIVFLSVWTRSPPIHDRWEVSNWQTLGHCIASELAIIAWSMPSKMGRAA